MSRCDQADDESIPPESLLLRLINPSWTKPDGQGDFRVTSQAFQDHRESGATSFLLADSIRESGRSFEDLVLNRPGYGVVAVPAGQLRALGLRLVRDPTEDEPGHVLVYGKKSGSVKNGMKQASTMVVRPAYAR